MNLLFSRYGILSSARASGKEHSSGIGLYMAKKMAEAMNGSLHCESEDGKGSMFTVDLPAASVKDIHNISQN